MSGNVLILEQFDDAAGGLDSAGVRAQQKRAADYAEGFAAGEAAALSRAMEQNQQLQIAAEAIERKLAMFDDMAAGHLCEALVAAVEKIFPALAEKIFAHEAAAAMNDIIQKSDKATLAVRTAPERLETVRAAIAALSLAERSAVASDDTLSGFEVCAEWDHGGISVDTEKATALFIAALEQATQELRDENKK